MMTLRIVFVTKSLQIPFRFFAWISSFVFTRVECWDCAWPLDRIFSIAPETCTRSRLAWTISPRDNFLIYCSWRPADQYQEIVFIIRVTLLYNYICIYFLFQKQYQQQKTIMSCLCILFYRRLTSKFLRTRNLLQRGILQI